MFEPDAAVAVALVLAKCSSEDWIYNQNLTGAHTRVKILTSSRNISNRFDISIFWVNVFFDRISPTQGQKSRQNIDANFCFEILTGFFDHIWAPSVNVFIWSRDMIQHWQIWTDFPLRKKFESIIFSKISRKYKIRQMPNHMKIFNILLDQLEILVI